MVGSNDERAAHLNAIVILIFQMNTRIVIKILWYLFYAKCEVLFFIDLGTSALRMQQRYEFQNIPY